MTEFVTLQRPSVVTDDFGAETTSYADYARVHAEIQWKSGSMANQVGEMFPEGHIEVLVRDAHPVAEKWRVVYQDVPYAVNAVEHRRVKGLKRLMCDKVNE